MAQIEDLRATVRNHEERIAKLEALINPPAEAENLLDDAPMTITVTGETLPPPPTITGDTNPEGGMGIVVSDNGQQPSVSDEVKEEPKDETN